jgi:hypothetical protein
MAGHAAAKARMGNPETELCRSLNNVPYSSTLPCIRVPIPIQIRAEIYQIPTQTVLT